MKRPAVCSLTSLSIAITLAASPLPAQPEKDKQKKENSDWVKVTEDDRAIKIETDKLEAVIP